MRASKRDLPVTFEGGSVVSRLAEWGKMNVALETFPGGTDTAPIFKGLPDDRCQCPHWGYVLKGRMKIRYPEREEVIEAGDAYYMEPGHLPLFEEDTEIIEFSPKGEYQKTMEVAEGNIASMQVGQ